MIKNVQNTRVMRILAALLCVVLLLVSTGGGSSAAHLDLALPVLFFCFLVTFVLSLWFVAIDRRFVQEISFLAAGPSRAPPLA